MHLPPEFQDLPYRDEPALQDRCKLNVYVPEDVTGFSTVVWFYGGGMMDGNRGLPDGLRDQGLAVVSPDYRLHPGTTAPGYIEDAAAAVAWTFQNLERFGGHPDKIILIGASAGGYLASLITLDKRWLAPYGIDPDALQALISLSGQAITHFTVRKERGIPEHCALVDDLAPLYHVRAGAPPILLVTGDRELELLGRYEENAYFMRMLKVAGHQKHQLHELPGRDHGGVEPDGLPLALEFIRALNSQFLIPNSQFSNTYPPIARISSTEGRSS
jgi:acetyl esterase/lipase